MASYVCPFCGVRMSLHFQTEARRNFTFISERISENAEVPYLRVSIYRCPNEACSQESVIAEGINGYIGNKRVPIHPCASFRQFPEYIPQAIRTDYEEACTILDSSPKAAATLARRCLQGMIHDFWDIHAKTLNAEITMLKDKVPASQWMAIDALRKIGNIGAHMEHDVNLIIDVDSSEARQLIRLIEHLLEKWYIDRHDAEMLYADLTEISKEKTAARKS